MHVKLKALWPYIFLFVFSPSGKAINCDEALRLLQNRNIEISENLSQSLLQMQDGDSIYLMIHIGGKDEYDRALSNLRKKNINLMGFYFREQRGHIAIRERIKDHIFFALGQEGVQSANTIQSSNDLLTRKNKTAEEKISKGLKYWNGISRSSQRQMVLLLISIWDEKTFNKFTDNLKMNNNIDVEDIQFNKGQPSGLVKVRGTKRNLAALLEKYPEIDKAQLL